MIKIDEVLEKVKDKFTWQNILFSTIGALIISFIVYLLVAPFMHYSNLNDFYVGNSIFNNYNKFFDIQIVLLYNVFFFLIFFLNKFKFSNINLKIDNRICNCVYIVLGVLISVKALLFVKQFTIPSILDIHHFGEQFGTYYLQAYHNMKYYIDIMLVHGYVDILPSFIADKILGELSFANERIAALLLNGCFLVLNIILAGLIFKRKIWFALLSSGMFLVLFYFPFGIHFVAGNSILQGLHCLTFPLFFLFLLEYNEKINIRVWTVLFFIFSSLMVSYHTTIGTVSVVGMLPLFLYKFKQNKKTILLCSIVCISLILLLCHQEILAYFEKAQYYTKSNLYSFGNGFPLFADFSLFKFLLGAFAYISLPVFCILLIKEPDYKIRIIALYVVLTAVCLCSYSFGRIDAVSYIPRAIALSLSLLTIFIPYILKERNFEFKDVYIVSIFIILLVNSFLYKDNYYQRVKNFMAFIPNMHNVLVAYNNEIDSEIIGERVLFLENAGMSYYYLQKKAAIPYVSFYNMVNSKQVEDELEKLKQNPPSNIIFHKQSIFSVENVKIPQRINKIYKWIFASGLYSIKEYDNAVVMTLSQNKDENYSYKNLNNISPQFLKFLPDAWGASVNTLPMSVVKDILIKENSNNEKNMINANISPAEADLLYIEFENPSSSIVDLKITIDDDEASLYFKSRTGKCLIPIDNYPSWLMKDKIDNIHLLTSVPIELKSAKLYNRN